MTHHLWDADPDVCCAAFQLGACQHTEAYADDDVDDAGCPVVRDGTPAPVLADGEPF